VLKSARLFFVLDTEYKLSRAASTAGRKVTMVVEILIGPASQTGRWTIDNPPLFLTDAIIPMLIGNRRAISCERRNGFHGQDYWSCVGCFLQKVSAGLLVITFIHLDDLLSLFYILINRC
jgi:hypothetical protein